MKKIIYALGFLFFLPFTGLFAFYTYPFPYYFQNNNKVTVTNSYTIGCTTYYYDSYTGKTLSTKNICTTAQYPYVPSYSYTNYPNTNYVIPSKFYSNNCPNSYQTNNFSYYNNNTCPNYTNYNTYFDSNTYNGNIFPYSYTNGYIYPINYYSNYQPYTYTDYQNYNNCSGYYDVYGRYISYCDY